MKSLFKAVALITIFSVLTRALGFFFRIFLSRVLGAEALGLYQVSMSVFGVLLTIVSSGLPLVISKLSAGLNVKQNKKEEASMITTALIIGLIASIILCVIVLVFNKVFNLLFTDDRCLIILFVMLPAVLFSSIYSTFRGALWGHSNFLGVCLSELFEQIIRIILCILFIAGTTSVMSSAISAASSLTVACAISSIFVTILYFVFGGRLAKPKNYTKKLLKSSVPITGVRIASSLIQPIIAIIVPLRLVSAGYTNAQALSIYGIAMGMTLPFIFIPNAITGSLSMALVPDLSSAIANEENDYIKNRITSSIIFTMFISLFFIPLYIGAGEFIGLFFYNNATSGNLLSSAAWIMLPLGLTNITSSILNALGLEMKSLKNYILGTIFMLFSIWFLPKYIGIRAIIVGMGVCMTLASILNIKMISKATNCKLNILKPMLKAILCCIPVSALVSFTSSLLANFLPLFFNLAISCSLGAIFFILICAVFGLINISAFLFEIKQKLKFKKENKKKKVKQT